MAEPLKNLYSIEFITNLAKSIHTVDNAFDKNAFEQSILNKNWGNLELKDRTLSIAQNMMQYLPYDYKKQIAILKKVAPEFTGFTGTIFPTVVEHYGLEEEALSLDALAFFTRFSTSEFAIRPFLIQNPLVIETLYKWSKNENFHIRRLASEGCRPLLPWAMKLQEYTIDPTPILPIIDGLKNDPEDYVYRSVANNLNDISKDHPELVLDLCESWKDDSKTTSWVAKHALRTLLKQGNQRAMKLFGFGSIKTIHVNEFKMENQQIAIGDNTALNISLNNTGSAAKFRLEYAIGYLKKNGKHNEKVFQLKEKELAEGETLSFKKKLDFKNLSTRKHYQGEHYAVLKVNGNVLNKIKFELL